MKVLQVHNRYRSNSPGGEDRVVDQEGAALAGKGHVVERFERENDLIDQWGPLRKAALAPGLFWSDRTRRDLAGVLRDLAPDVVHVHNTFPLITPSVLFACRRAQVPVVLTLHNFRMICTSGELFRDGKVCHDCIGRMPLPGIRHGCYRDSKAASAAAGAAMLAHRRLWRELPSAFVFISEAQRRRFGSLRLPEHRTFVKANLIPAVGPGCMQREHTVVFAGRLAANKGVEVLLEAWDRYAAARPAGGLRLVVAGAGPLGDRVAEWSATRPSVRYAGLLTRADCAALVASSRAVLLPSTWEEGFGLVAVEAMAAGVPPIASDLGSFPELIRHGVDGILFEAGNAAALADVLCDVDARPGRYAALGSVARGTYRERFDPDENLEQLLAIYRFAIEDPVFGRRCAQRCQPTVLPPGRP